MMSILGPCPCRQSDEAAPDSQTCSVALPGRTRAAGAGVITLGHVEFFATFHFWPGTFISIGTAKTRRDKIPLRPSHACRKATNHTRAGSLGMKQTDMSSGEADPILAPEGRTRTDRFGDRIIFDVHSGRKCDDLD